MRVSPAVVMFRFACALVAWGLFSCDLSGGGGGGGFGGGDALVNFTKGYVFVRKDDRNVYVVNDADVNTVGVLTTNAGVSMPTLSKDARTVVFARKSGLDSSIELVPTSGGTARVLVASSPNAFNLRTPVFSPDGTFVAFTFERGGQARLGIVNIDGSDFRQLVANASLSYAFPSFSPDGLAIFAAAGTSANILSQIERIDLKTGMAQNVINTLGNEAVTVSSRLAVSPDGSKVVFDARVGSGVTRIFGYDLAAKTGPSKVNDYSNEPNTNDTAPGWVGLSAVSFSSDSGGNDNVYQVNFDATARRLALAKAIEASYGPQ